MKYKPWRKNNKGKYIEGKNVESKNKVRDLALNFFFKKTQVKKECSTKKLLLLEC